MNGYQRTPEGLLCINDMPPPDTRWVARRKALIVAGVRAGLLSEAEACERYALSREELVDWIARYGAGGRPALATLKPLQARRHARRRG
jgi:hypothetical protein